MPTPRLGQHFLHSRSVLEQLLSAAPLDKQDTILEIGPGKGILTEELLKRAARVVAVEKDPELYHLLEECFSEQLNKSLYLIAQDVRDLSPDKTPLKELLTEGGRYRVVANIPYYLTGRLLRHLLTAEQQPRSMVLLLQKEVVERMVGSENSLLALSVRVYGTPKLVKKVPAGCFSPPPQVDSAILAITDIGRGNFQDHSVSEEFFFEVLKSGWAHRRKYLRSNLKKNLSVNGELVDQALTQVEADQQSRPEELNLKQWLELAAFLQSSK